MKKLISLLVISMFALAACVPTDSSVTENSATIDTEVRAMETEDSTSGDSAMDESETPETTETEMMDMEASGSMDVQSARVVEVTIRDGAFDPQEITIHETTTINWINADSVEHTLAITKMDDSSDDAMDDSSDDTSDDNDDSSITTEITLSPGETASFSFEDSGVYEFALSGNANLSGRVMVSDDYDHDAYDDLYEDDDMDDNSSDSYNDDSSDDSNDDYEEDDEEDKSDDYESTLFSIAA